LIPRAFVCFQSFAPTELSERSMALSFDQNINVASLFSTWLGSPFALLGLLAVIAQLRALLKDLKTSQTIGKNGSEKRLLPGNHV